MDKKAFNKALESHIAEVGAEEATKQSVTVFMVGAGASAAMCMRELTNNRLAELGVKVEPRGTTEEIKALREAIDVSEGFNTYEDFATYCDELAEAHSVPVKRVIKEVKASAKEEEVTVPKKGNLGAQKKAIIAYFKDHDLGSTTIPGLATYLFDETDIQSKDDALRQARQQYSFAVELIKVGQGL